MEITNRMLGFWAVVLAAAIGLHQFCRWRTRCGAEEASGESGGMEAPALSVASGEYVLGSSSAGEAEPAAEEGAIEPEAAVVVAETGDGEAERRRLLDQQAWQMERYALEAGADDPFALSREQIEEFRKSGEPYLW